MKACNCECNADYLRSSRLPAHITSRIGVGGWQRPDPMRLCLPLEQSADDRRIRPGYQLAVAAANALHRIAQHRLLVVPTKALLLTTTPHLAFTVRDPHEMQTAALPCPTSAAAETACASSSGLSIRANDVSSLRRR